MIYIKISLIKTKFLQINRLNKLVHLITFFLFALSITSCKKIEKVTDEYYVKYEINSTTIYSGRKLSANFKKEDNQFTTLTIDANAPWEIIVGPIKKGFIASINASEIVTNYGHLTLSSKISVSKNGSPFAIKSFDDNSTPRSSVDINYVIDY